MPIKTQSTAYDELMTLLGALTFHCVHNISLSPDNRKALELYLNSSGAYLIVYRQLDKDEESFFVFSQVRSDTLYNLFWNLINQTRNIEATDRMMEE